MLRLAFTTGILCLLSGCAHSPVGPDHQHCATIMAAGDILLDRGVKKAIFLHDDPGYPMRDLPVLFEEADIFILPSYFENFPIAVLEAMAAGLPLIVTPVGALPEVLNEGEHCLFIKAGDIDGLADRLKQLVAAPEQRAAMGAANAALFRQEFDRPAILAKIEHAYLRAMNQVIRAS